MSGKFINRVYKEAICKYGKDAQIKMVFEEMAELSKEICKNFRGKQNKDLIAEEVADVRIMLDQLCLIFDIVDEADAEKEYKLARLAQRLHITE